MPDIAHANPLPGRPAAIAYHDLAHACAADDGRRLLGPLVAHSRRSWSSLSDKRSRLLHWARVPSRLRMLAQGHPCLAWSLAGEDARVVHRRCRPRDFTVAVTGVGAGLMLATLAYLVGCGRFRWAAPRR